MPDYLKDVRDLWKQLFALGVMACCGLPTLYQNGPSAGMSQNIRCCHCGAEWNLTPFGPERIGVSHRRFVESLPKPEVLPG